ncbi:GNAT family N-acetyltransferase [Paracoccus sp. p3-h83]|uniref:GNAT family N-acetyltransferase n=1 Tax=Paracoccus sp. p3-h83 TaxID=3342805 RepID=UPI0035BB1F28
MDISLTHAIADIDPADWDACACPETADGGRPLDPFTTHRFLSALEGSGSVGSGTGWAPHHLTLRDGGRLVGVMPLYLKSHSQGEYVFDQPWAEAFDRAGGSYYPKLQAAVPFTPVPGRRLLTRPGHDPAPLLAALADLTTGNGLSSAHVTFCTADEPARAPEPWLVRLGQQYHWTNAGYRDFDDFLSTMAARKRKAIRRERAEAQSFGGQIEVLTGDQITAPVWDAMWGFYQHTGARKWGRPYLTRAFFDLAAQHLADDCLIVLARQGGRPVAGALNLIGRQDLFGRYWGAVQDHPFLHFELCYHQAIDWAIAHGLARVQAGAQGDHKLARGYLPVATHSLHYIAHPGLRRAVADYLLAERQAVGQDIEVLTAYGPFRRGPLQDQT